MHFAPGSFQCPQSAWSTALPRGRSSAGRCDNTKPGADTDVSDKALEVGMILEGSGWLLVPWYVFLFNVVLKQSPSKEIDLYSTCRVLILTSTSEIHKVFLLRVILRSTYCCHGGWRSHALCKERFIETRLQFSTVGWPFLLTVGTHGC